MQRIVITVDGLAASGKTSLASLLAARLGFAFISTGLIYRAIGLEALSRNISPDDAAALGALIRSSSLEFQQSEGHSLIALNGVRLGSELFSPENSDMTSKLSVHKIVRELLLPIQRNAFAGHNLVAEGRDAGSVVFADALVKFFISASAETRQERRLKQAGLALNQAQLEQELELRDKRDKERDLSPTKAAPDAIQILNDSADIDQVLDQMLEEVRAILDI